MEKNSKEILEEIRIAESQLKTSKEYCARREEDIVNLKQQLEKVSNKETYPLTIWLAILDEGVVNIWRYVFKDKSEWVLKLPESITNPGFFPYDLEDKLFGETNMMFPRAFTTDGSIENLGYIRRKVEKKIRAFYEDEIKEKQTELDETRKKLDKLNSSRFIAVINKPSRD